MEKISNAEHVNIKKYYRKKKSRKKEISYI